MLKFSPARQKSWAMNTSVRQKSWRSKFFTLRDLKSSTIDIKIFVSRHPFFIHPKHMKTKPSESINRLSSTMSPTQVLEIWSIDLFPNQLSFRNWVTDRHQEYFVIHYQQPFFITNYWPSILTQIKLSTPPIDFTALALWLKPKSTVLASILG